MTDPAGLPDWMDGDPPPTGIAPPPAVNEGPFEARPADAPPPHTHPYRYLIAYRAAGKGSVQPVWGNWETFSSAPIRGSETIGAARAALAQQVTALVQTQMDRDAAASNARRPRLSSLPPRSNPRVRYTADDIAFVSITLLAKEA